MASVEKRETKGGQTTYRVKVRLKGYPVQTATFDRLTDAKKWVQHTEAAIREGRHFKVAESKKHTLSELIERYIKDVLPTKPKQIKDQTTQLNWWKAELGAYALSDVTPALLVECRDKLAQEPFRNDSPRSPSTVVRYMAALSHAYTVAINEWGWVEDSPISKVKKPKEARGRVRFLSKKELDSLLDASKKSDSQLLYPAILLAVSTGMRQGEQMSLRWKHVDLATGKITIEDTKNGERRATVATGPALDELKKLANVRRIDNDHVFLGKHSHNSINLRKPFEKALAKAEIEDFRWHDLRHTFASNLAMSGATLAELAEALGHKTLAMVKRYAHLTEGHISSVIERMTTNVFGGAE